MKSANKAKWRCILRFELMCLVFLAETSECALEDAVFTPGRSIFDNRGQQVHANGGRLVQLPSNEFLLIGEGAKSGCDASTSSSGGGCQLVNWEQAVSQGFNLYQSTDLMHWTWLGEVLSRADVTEDACHPYCRMERPKLVQDRASADWLILFHVARTDFSYNGVGVARGAGPAGPFTYQGSFLPNDWASYDMNIFEDVDGAYYLARSLGNTPKIAVSRLAPDFMSVEAACNFYTEAKGEAPTIFRTRTGSVMMLLSEQTWWIPNRATLAVSSNVCPENEASQFAAISPPAEGEGSATTFDSQPVQVFLFPCSNGRSFYMYMGDRWNFNGPGSLGNASHVWLPFLPRSPTDPNQGYVIVDRDSWSPRDYCGEPNIVQRKRTRHRRYAI